MEYVQDEAGLAEAGRALADAELVGVDTEAAGYHRYDDRICLLQLSSRTRTFVVDTLELSAVDPIARVLGNADIEVVLHDADYDLRLLARDFGIQVNRLFDTRIAAQFLGQPALGLGGLAEAYLGITLEKKFQKADWARRPLSPEMLEYAAEDTRHLPALRDRMRELLVERGRLAWAQEEFALREGTRWENAAPEEQPFMRLKGTRDLKPRELAVLRELHGWREDVARERDVATFRVLTNETLLELARQRPARMHELTSIRGISPAMAERRGSELLNAIRRGVELPEDALPRRPRSPRRPPPSPEFEAAVDRLRAARDRAAERLGLDRGFLMPRAQLEAVARAEPSSTKALAAVDGIRQWQIEALGEELVQAYSPQGSKPNVR